MSSTMTEVELDGDLFAFDPLDLTDPNEATVRVMGRMQEGNPGAVFDLIRLLGVNPDGWRMSKAGRFLEEAQKAAELTVGEHFGSEKSSEPTRKKSSTPSSSKD